jgi:hypothetical protein
MVDTSVKFRSRLSHKAPVGDASGAPSTQPSIFDGISATDSPRRSCDFNATDIIAFKRVGYTVSLQMGPDLAEPDAHSSDHENLAVKNRVPFSHGKGEGSVREFVVQSETHTPWDCPLGIDS